MVNPKKKSDFVVNNLSYKGCFFSYLLFPDDFDKLSKLVTFHQDIAQEGGNYGQHLMGILMRCILSVKERKKSLWFVKIDETVATTSD